MKVFYSSCISIFTTSQKFKIIKIFFLSSEKIYILLTEATLILL